MLPCHARCVLSRLRCNGYSLLLGSYLSRMAELRILPAAPVDTRPRTYLISFCTVQLRTLCTAHSLATLCLSTTSEPDTGELPGFWGSMVFRHAPIPQKPNGFLTIPGSKPELIYGCVRQPNILFVPLILHFKCSCVVIVVSSSC